MANSDAHCNLETFRSQKRTYAAYLKQVVSRIETQFGTHDDTTALLSIESPEEFLEQLLVPQHFLHLIQVIKHDTKQPRCVKPTENGLMQAAICIGSAMGMRTPSGPLTMHARLKWAWQLIRLDLQSEVSEKQHPDFTAVFERMCVSADRKKHLDYRKLLLLWVGYQLKGKAPTPTDFKDAFRDGRVYIHLLNEILDPSTTENPCDKVDTIVHPLEKAVPPFDVSKLLSATAEERADFVEKTAVQLGLGDFICAQDILGGYDRVNLVFVSQLLKLFPSIDTFTILITRGIQNDYCGIGYKSSVHIGTDEAIRLHGTREKVGESNFEGLVSWARKQSPDSFALIHVRDIHRLDDPEQGEHLAKFGAHCLEGTKGAQMICGLFENETTPSQESQAQNDKKSLEECATPANTQEDSALGPTDHEAAKLAPNEYFIDVTGVNDVVGTGLEPLMNKLRTKALGFLIRVGVVGVSTDFQITNLLYELQTRMGIKNLATCSALTAARTRRAHFAALDNIERMLDANVFHSIADFAFWLCPSKGQNPLGAVTKYGSPIPHREVITRRSSPIQSILEKIEFAEKHLLLAEDCAILENLFRSASRIVIVSKLTGGFSGAMVLLAKSFDLEGHEQGPFVIKLGQIDDMAQERTNFERIEEIIGNQAPYVYGSYEASKRAGLKFAFASHCGDVFSTSTFRHAYRDPSTPQGFIDKIISKVSAVLNRFYSVARMRSWDLLGSYDFDGRGWALAAGGSDEPQALAVRISALLHDTANVPDMETLDFGQGVQFYNVWRLMNDLRPLKNWCDAQTFLVSFVHGDLNFSNILIDGSVNVWLIDFQYTTKAHYLKDLAKLENDAQSEVSLDSHEDFDFALKITAMLHKYSPYDSSSDLEEECERLLPTLPTKLQKVALTVVAVRALIRQVNLGREQDPRAYHITMMRYALHSMCFHYLSHYTRKWALANACSHAQTIVKMLANDAHMADTNVPPAT